MGFFFFFGGDWAFLFCLEGGSVLVVCEFGGGLLYINKETLSCPQLGCRDS